MNILSRLYERISYRLVKWWISRKLRRFLPKRQYNVVIRFYDQIWEV